MIKAELKNIHSPDILDLIEYKPEIKDKFGFLLQIIIGISGIESEEIFEAIVCTPKWLMEEYGERNVIFGHHHIIVFLFDYAELEKRISLYVNNLCGENWSEIVNKMSLIGRWEFEDYTE